MQYQRVRRAIVLAVAGILLAAAAVFADTITADGDSVAPGATSPVYLGVVAPGAVINRTVTFELTCSGTKHVNPDQTVLLDLSSMTIPVDASASGTSSSFNSPGSAWPADGSPCTGNEAAIPANESSEVSITAPSAPGVGYRYTMRWLPELDPLETGDIGTFKAAIGVTFVLDVVGNQPPVLNLPANITAEGTTTGGASVRFSVGATDAEDSPPPTPVCSPASGAFFALGDTTVSCTVTDSGGLSASGSFRVTVVDTTAPSLSGLPGDQTLVTNDPAGATISYTLPTATDIVDPNAGVSCTPASGSVVPVGYTQVRCKATDASGNSATASFGVTVQLNAAPVLALPLDMTVEGTAPGGATVTYAASATDAEDNPDPTPVCSPASGSFFGLGDTIVSCTVTDSGGRTASGSFRVTVVDTTAPILSGLPADQALVTNDPAGATIGYTLPTATDIVDANPVVTCSPASGSVAPLGDSVVACTATDASGNSAARTFGIAVHLNTAPVLSLPVDMTVEGTATGGATVDYTASAIDAEDSPDPAPVCSTASGAFFALGETIVTCAVADSGGLTASGSFRITVVDTTAPTISGLPANQHLITNDPAGATISYTLPTATDIVDANPGVSCTPASGSPVPVGYSDVTCTATDASGNSATRIFGIGVHLNTAPVLTLPANISLEGDTTGGARVTFTATATDAEDQPDPAPTCAPASGSLFAVGTTTVSCSATDANGKTASGTFTVTVVDTTAPTLSGGTTDLSLTTTNPNGAAMSYTRPSASDVVDARPVVSCSPASGSVAPVGSSFVNCTAIDASGNIARSRFPVNVTLVAADSWSATWEEPIGPPAAITANAGRSIPVKLRIYLNGVEVVTGTAFLRVVPCGGPPPTFEIPLTFGGRWTGKIDTSALTGDCYRVAVIAGTTEAGSFRLDLAGITPVKTPAKQPVPAPVKAPKNH